MKRLALCLALALLVLAGSVSFAEQVETIVPGTTVTYSAADIDADNSAEGFIHSLFYPSKPTGLLKKAPAKTAGSKLTGADRVMYDTMAAQIPLIASGERASTVFAFPAEDIYDKLSYTAEDLGVSSIIVDGAFNQEAVDAVSAIITNIDASNAVHALLVDMPYELYWFDKTAGWSTGYPSLSGSSEEITIVGEVTVSLSVAAEYSAGEYAFNTSLGQAATQAAQNAQSIVASYAGKPDLEQLRGFKDEICALTSYNDAAAGGGVAYGNPWQLVWVFDGNETTKVVCEGYSKAFKYLVDQSSCAATARLVSGVMSGGTGEGPHMWNIVRLQNTQYLVDVTNCDEGTVGSPDKLFMVSDAVGSAETNYTASGVKYTYDEDTVALYGYEALTLGSVTPEVVLTISPNTDLLLYQNVTYTVDAQGADKVKLVIGNDDEEIDITQQNEDGQWVLTWSSVFGGEIEVYAKASFDGGETWISSEKQTLNFEVLGNVTFKVTPDSDIVTKGEPIVIRFSEMDMISDVSNPQVYIIRDGEEIDVSVSDCITTTASEMTCDTTNLEAGTYRFGFWGLPAELGYPECYVTAEVTVVEKTSAPTVTAYAMLSDETVVPEGGTVWIGSNISWELVSEGADEFEWTANGFETYALDSTFDPENNNRPDEEGLLIPVEEYRTGFARVFLSTGPWMDIEEYTFKARTRAEGKEWSDWTEMHFEVQSKGTLAAPMFTVNNGYDIHLGDQLTVVVDAVENAESYAVVILDKADFFAEFAAGDSAGTYTLRGDQIPVTGEYTVVVTAYADGYMWNYAEQTITVLETAGAAQIVEINETNFPDAVFRGIVTGFDTDADGWLSEDEISEVTSVSAPSAGITSVKGVEYFTALEELVLNDNTIASLDVSANTALTTLGVWKNQLTELDVSKLPELKFLQCGKNQLTELDLKNNTKLTELYCGENLLETIDISPLTELEMLECSANQLSSLNVSSNLSLRTLDCGNNKLEALDVSKNTVLKELICANNQLKSLDVTTNTGLVRLACGKNQLETLDVSKNTALTDLDCSGNNLGTLDVINNTGLTNLACQGNQIVSLNTSSNSELTHLYCGENELTSLNVSGNTKLTYLECYNNPIAELDLTLCTSLSQLVQTEGIERTHADWGDCWEDSDADLWLAVDASTTVKAGDYVSKGSGATVTGIAINEANFPDDAFRTYVAENCDDGDAVLTEDELKAVTRMNCDRLSITDLQGIEYFTSLEYLSVLRTQITGIDVSANTALVTLRCSYTPLESLDVSMLPKLASLTVDMTQLHSLDLSHNPELDTLDCVDVPITSLDVSYNPVLRRLYCDDCSFTELDVSKNPSLVILCCSNLQLTSLNLNNNPILQTLDCGKNQLTSLDISGNPELENLSCGENQLTSLDLSNNPKLKIVHCNGNEFIKLNIAACEKIIDIFSSNDPTDQGTYLTYGEDEYGNIQFSVDKDVAVITGASETTPVLTVSPVAESYDYSQNVEVTAAITLPDGSTEGLAERYPDAGLSATLMTADGEIVDGFIVQSVSALEYTFDFPLADDDMPAGDYKVRIETNVEDLVAETNTFYYTADKANAPDPTECQVQLTVSPSVFGLNERFEMTAYVTDANGEPAEGIKVGFIVLNSDGSTAPFYTDYDWLYNVTKEDGTCGIAVTKGEESELPSGQYTVQAFIVDGTASDSKPVTFVSEDHSTHNLLKHDRVEPTYTSTGIEEYWECIVCGKLFSDAEGKNEISEPVIIPMLTPHIHTLTAHARVEASCTEVGTEAYWQCEECEKYFSDEEAKNEIEGPVVIPAKGHTPVAIPAVEATCTETGLTEGEKCSVCEAILTAQEVVPALGHAYKATFTWDGFTCTGALICEHDDKHIVPLEVEVSSAETTPAGDDTPGVRTYTATAVYEEQTYTDTKLEEIPALMVIDENGVLVEYNGTASEIIVPDSVSSIGAGAFEGKSNITSVKIPSSVKSIGASAFAETGLTSITIPSSVTSIGASAFAGTAITSVTIPSSVTSIGANAFAGTQITEVNIGESVISIGDGAFDAGTTINTPAGSTAAEWAAGHDCTVNETIPAQPTVSLTISPNTNLLLYQDVTYTVDAQGADKVKLVFGNDDEGMDITRQNAEGQWVLTWSHVFGGEIEVYAKASFDGGETWISSEKQTLNFEVLGDVTFKATPDSDTVTKGNPIVIRFSEKDKIERIGNPEVSIVTDGVETGVSISESITMTQTEMTCDTTNLEAGTYRFGFWGLPAELGYPECYVTAEVNVVEETTPTPTDEPTVEPAVEPSTEPTAEPTATPVPTMPSTVSDSTGSYNIGSDGTATFSKPAGSAATVSIPATITVNGQTVRVTAIADKAFQKDKKLTTVTIGKNIKTIGKNAFANCAKLKTVKGGAAVTTIKDGAFSGCKVLKTFPAMNKLQKIGNNAFKGAKALAKFTLAKTVTSIGKNAFNGCAGLKTITVKTEKLTNKNVGAGAFKGINKKATFKCPKKQLKNYKTLFVKKGAPKTCKFK